MKAFEIETIQFGEFVAAAPAPHVFDVEAYKAFVTLFSTPANGTLPQILNTASVEYLQAIVDVTATQGFVYNLSLTALEHPVTSVGVHTDLHLAID